MANPNPSPETRFQPGNPGGGKTSEQKRLEYEAALMAAKARHKLLSVITEKLNKLPDGEILAEQDMTKLLSSDMLRLFKDSEDRAHGTPKQSVEHTGEGGGPIQTLDVTNLSDGALREIMAALSASSKAQSD